ncbi:MAG: gliding motility-associated C-terminal domain-containing protein [Cytophagales bacterium]|nr:MAG: gliding motility-associated C-terminal domain-containing protein [Cytophagales bacterium]
MNFVKILIIIGLTLLMRELFAQNNFVPCFKTEIIKGCAPLKVRPIDCSGVAANLIFYDYGDGRGPVPDKEVTYSKAGKYAVTQLLNSGGGGGMKTDGQYFIEVSNPIVPTIEVELCAGFKATVKVVSTDYSEYFIDFGNGKSSVVKGGESATTSYGSATPVAITVLGNTNTNVAVCGSTQKTIIPIQTPPKGIIRQVKVLSDDRVQVDFDLNSSTSYQLLQNSVISDEQKKIALASGATQFISTDKISAFEIFRYRVLAIDKCTGEDFLAGETITAHKLSVANIQKKNVISWNPSKDLDFGNYTIYRNNQVLTTIKDRETLFFEDLNIKCGQTYCYRVEAVANKGTTKSISATVCSTAPKDSDPKAVAQFVANIVKESIEIRWQVPNSPPQATFLLRADGNGNTTKIQIPNQPPYIDVSAYITSNDYCYKLIYIDECGNTSPESAIACPIRLIMSNEDDRITLNWAAVGASLTFVEKLDEQGNPYTSISTSANTFVELKSQFDRQFVRYRIGAIINGILVYSNIVSVRVDAILIFPNAFSPNNDGLNDTFGVKASFIKDFRLQIFSRWGILMYESTDTNSSWDGKYNGETVQAGEYIFTIEGADMIGKKIDKKGILTVVR